jgi:hypothetical protein
MLTIKHILPNGNERVFPVTSVERTEEGLSFGSQELITSGKVYLMNDAGKTVALYDFENAPRSPVNIPKPGAKNGEV